MPSFTNTSPHHVSVPWKGGPLVRESPHIVSIIPQNEAHKRQSYSKVFRYNLPDGHTDEPKTVEIVGSFTHWHKVTMGHDGKTDGWHVTIHHIPGNKMHHYMLLVDGEPTFDPTCDGLAPPFHPQEERYQLQTTNGPRVLMLCAQTR